MVLGKLPVPGRPTIWITVGQGPTALAVGAGGGCLDIFTLIYPFFPLSPSLWETARYRLKYCLKGPLNPKQTNQSQLQQAREKPIGDSAVKPIGDSAVHLSFFQNNYLRVSLRSAYRTKWYLPFILRYTEYRQLQFRLGTIAYDGCPQTFKNSFQLTDYQCTVTITYIEKDFYIPLRLVQLHRTHKPPRSLLKW